VELATVQQACQRVAARTPLVVLQHACVVERERGVVGKGRHLPACLGVERVAVVEDDLTEVAAARRQLKGSV
jgi:hypothetical protein